MFFLQFPYILDSQFFFFKKKTNWILPNENKASMTTQKSIPLKEKEGTFKKTK